jgi:large subunit ribosomal protein L5e
VRWRAEGKTDYRARKRLVAQEKNKYQSHRYRLVVRITNTTVITQIIYSEIDGDHVLVSAYSSELKNYGLKVGLKNYAAAYATGLLVARRALKKLGMDDLYKGNKDVNGELFEVEEVDGRRPFKACLDIGTRATTTGARIFGAMKGASDGGLYVPHSEKRFPGYNRESSEYDANVHKSRIFGNHVADYMRALADEPEKLAKLFSRFAAAGVEADGLEAVYKKVHAVSTAPCPAWLCVSVLREGSRARHRAAVLRATALMCGSCFAASLSRGRPFAPTRTASRRATSRTT